MTFAKLFTLRLRHELSVLVTIYAFAQYPAYLRTSNKKSKFVYVIGLHAVQFGNNWMKKIPRTAKNGRGRRPSPIWLSEEKKHKQTLKRVKLQEIMLLNPFEKQKL